MTEVSRSSRLPSSERVHANSKAPSSILLSAFSRRACATGYVLALSRCMVAQPVFAHLMQTVSLLHIVFALGVMQA